MALDERARHTLYAWMQETADDEKADALMASLPPTAWPDLATKQDLAILRADMKGFVHDEVVKQTWVFIAWTGGLVITLAGFFWTVAR